MYSLGFRRRCSVWHTKLGEKKAKGYSRNEKTEAQDHLDNH